MFCQAKYLVLLLLVIQNTFFVLLMRYSRTRPGELYLSSTAVCCDEGLKLVTCLGILTFTYFFKKRKESPAGDDSGEYTKLARSESNGTSCVSSDDDSSVDIDEENGDDNYGIENDDIADETTDTKKPETFLEYLKGELQFDFRVAGIALIFVVQKNLLYLAVSNLDAAVFQVTYQLKVLTTALFSVTLLKRSLSYQKIAALILLTMGVALVQLDKVEENASKSFQEQRRWVGVLAVLGACCTSGFGGVYFELIVKPHENDKSSPARAAPSVWAKNVQLSTFGLIIALITAFSKDFDSIISKGFFQGYNGIVLGVIILQAGGGLVVAAIIKYADNILKNFATAVSIVTSTIVSAWVFDFSVSMLFMWGCVLQFFAIYLYSKKDTPDEEKGTPCKLNLQTSSVAMMESCRIDSLADIRKRHSNANDV